MCCLTPVMCTPLLLVLVTGVSEYDSEALLVYPVVGKTAIVLPR